MRCASHEAVVPISTDRIIGLIESWLKRLVPIGNNVFEKVNNHAVCRARAMAAIRIDEISVKSYSSRKYAQAVEGIKGSVKTS